MKTKDKQDEKGHVGRLWLLLQEPKTMGDRIRFLRIAQGMTQSNVAARAGQIAFSDELTKSFVSLLEADRTQPSVKTLAAIAQVLGASMDYLWSGRPARRSRPSIRVSIRKEMPEPAVIRRRPRVFVTIRRERDGKTERIEHELNRVAIARLGGLAP